MAKERRGTDQDEGIEYDLEFIIKNPIQTICTRCGKREPINAPSLENVRCFWCAGFGKNEKPTLRPLDERAYQERLDNLWRYAVGQGQLRLF